jgi:hypothetical protein
MRYILILLLVVVGTAAVARPRVPMSKIDGGKHSMQEIANMHVQSVMDTLETGIELDSAETWTSKKIALQEEKYGYPSVMDLLIDLEAGSVAARWYEYYNATFDSVGENDPEYELYTQAAPLDSLGQIAIIVPHHMADSLWFEVTAMEDGTEFNAGYSSARP